MHDTPARHQPILITAVALTAVCAVAIPFGVAMKVLSPGVLAVALLLGCVMTWVIVLVDRHEDRVVGHVDELEDHVVEHVDEIQAAVAYAQRPRVVRDSQR